MHEIEFRFKYLSPIYTIYCVHPPYPAGSKSGEHSTPHPQLRHPCVYLYKPPVLNFTYLIHISVKNTGSNDDN